MGTSPLSIARHSLAHAREVRTELRAIDTAAANRPYTPDEQARIETGIADIAMAEARADAQLRIAERGNATADGLRALGLDLDTPGPAFGGRSIGGIAPVAFTDDTLHELHEAYQEGRAHSVHAETRAVSAAPMATIPAYNTSPYPYRREPVRLAALMPVQTVEATTATYYTASAAASAAATVAVGATKPESTPGWQAVTVPVRKIAHYSDVPTEYLADFPSFAQVVGTELTAGLIHAENGQILTGNGTAPNLTGLLNTSGILTYAPGAAEDYFVSVLEGITMLRTPTAYTDADTVLLHPTDWQTILLTRDSEDGMIVHHNPTEPSAATLWGKRVVLTTAVTAGTAVVANMADGTLVFQRETPRITVDPYSQSNKNLVRFICEERIAFGSPRPSALLTIAFNDGA
ncbi:MAG: hypothetical protein JWO77_1436 [Ilumatobacteraceae bacterium]|nr:hypothetical protein [Ilumatobacteraceae bacterium]